MALHCWKEFWKLRHTRYAVAWLAQMVYALIAMQKQSILSTSIWDTARFYFLRLNDFWDLTGKNSKDAEKRDLS